MLISLLPAVSATSAASDISEGITIKYDLSSHLAELGLTRKNTKDSPITEPKITAIDDITRGLYKFSAGMSYTSAWGDNLYARGANSIAFAHNLIFRNYVSFEISVPADGTYYLSVDHGAHTAGTDVSVYVNEETFERGKHADNGALIGTYSAYTSNTKFDNYDTIVTSDVLNTSGEKAAYSFKAEKKYILTFAEDTSKTSNYGSVGSFSLIAGDGAVPIDVDITGVDTYRLRAKVYMSDGSINPDAEAVWSGYDTGVISVSEDGSVSVRSEGETPLTVTVTMGDFTVTKTETVSVKAPPVPNKTITYDIASRMGDKGDTSILFTDFTYATNNNLWEYAANRRSSYSYAVDYFDNDPETNPEVNTTVTSGSQLVYTLGKGMQIRAGQNNWWAIKIRVDEAGLYVPKVTYGTYKNDSPYKLNGTYVTDKDGENVIVYPESYLDYYLIPVDENVSVKKALVEANLNSETLIGTVACTDPDSADKTMRTKDLKKINFAADEYYVVFKPRFVSPITEPGTVAFASAILTLAGNITLDGINCIQELVVDAKQDLAWNEEAPISIGAFRLDGTKITDYQATYSSSNTKCAVVSEDGVIKGIAEGKATITVTVSDGVGAISKEIPVTVTDKSGAKEFLYNLTEKLYVNEKLLLDIDAVMNSENVLDVGAQYITYTCEPESVARIEDGIITAVSEGKATVTATVNFRGLEKTFENTVTVIPDDGKTAPTLYTNEMRENAQENIAKYDWAKSTQKSAIKAADKLMPEVELIKTQIFGEGLPRGRQIGVRGDDYYIYCRYCHANVGRGPGVVSMSRPWKVQCPDCKRLFPSNDFEGFLKLGLDESGRFFDVDRARQAHHEMLFHKDGEECTCEKPAKKQANTPEWYVFYGYGNPDGYLYNELYSEIRESNEDPWGDLITWNKETIKDEQGEVVEVIDHGADLGTYTDDAGNVLWQGGDMWGVDDGWGYLPGRTYDDGLEERHGYIARYNNSLWEGLYGKIRTIADAYLYTNDVKYGRAGAVLLDRVADVWPSFDMYYFRNQFMNTHGGSGYGAAVGRINDSYVARELLHSADILYPMVEDDELIRTLSEDAENSKLENDKKSSESIWKNWEEGIILASYQMLQDGRINGNFGQAQGVAGLAAIVVGKQPETNDILNWVYATDAGNGKTKITGGNLESTLINRVDRDGMGDEASPRYNTSWVSNLSTFADATAMYTGEGDYQPYNVPKFIKMYTPQIDILLTNSKHPNVGDAGSVASVTLNGGTAAWLQAFARTDNEEYKKKIANYIYTVNGNKTTGYRYDIFTKDPESLEEDILKYIDPDQKTESTILTGYGIAILRDGAKYDSASAATAKNTMRDIWVTFGRSASHAHTDTLNLGMDAYGLDVAPDLGYPEDTSYTPNRLQWVDPTISHNTVTVNEANHDKTIKHGYPLHFDDTETVKLIDVDASNVNSNTEKYRRSVVMIKANDDVSYAVDFFRVTGGNTHTYSFHSQAENAYPVSGIELTKQVDENGEYIGTYAGVDGKDPETGEWIEYGPDPWTKDEYGYPTKYNRGYTWMNKIRRDKEPEQNISVEFDVQDYNKILTDGKNIKLRLTQMNNFTPDEVAIVGGYVPIKSETEKLPRTLDYLLVHNRGENLDSLFTTVLEPYKGERYVSDIKTVDISVKTGTEIAGEDMARAVKVAHTNGRVDYVVYATNNDVVYTVTDTFVKADGTEMPISFDFSGFVGVYTVNENGACIYRYVNDGTVIGEETEKTAAYTGTVTGFQKGYEIENYIDVEMQCDDLSDLAGKVIYVDNDRVENGAYRILSASREGEGLKEGSIRLDIGTVTLIRSHIDKFDFDKGYVYNIKEEQTFTIPTSFEDESLPEFEPVSDTLSTSAGSSISVTVKATSPIETDTPTITYIGATLPRGASLNSETGVFTWKPTDSQVGDNHVAITARDSDGRETTIHFDISVYGNTTGSGNKTEENSGTSTENAGTAGGGGGGGGGGGAAPTDKPDDETKTDENDNGEASGDTETGTGETAPDASGETDSIRFTDLSNHTWAADAINTLADDGIIRGTASDTYSPANNITRADFASLLIRAFKLESDNAENFADVTASDYFASELAIARNTGIVNGIGDNKFAPRNTITRQDMMVIVHRALQKQNVGFGDSNEPNYSDFTTVADYAKEAVSALIGAGIVNGKSGRIAPADYTTRAEVAVLIKRILDYKASLA